MVTIPDGPRYRRPRRQIVIPDRVAQRAALRVSREGECDISTYSVASHGYAQIGWQDGGDRWVVTAHRAAWVYATGQQIPTGMTIDHLCRNRRCVRFEHLRMLSNYENARRTNGRDWPLGQCVNGHPDELGRLHSSGKRSCRECAAEWQRRHRARKVAQRTPVSA